MKISNREIMMSNLIQNQFFLEILQIFLLGWLRSAQGQWDFQTFAVHNDKIISSSDTVVGKRTIRSSVMCANLCVERDNCCSATYKQDTLECMLDSCCNPTMENSTPTSVMLKPFNAALQVDHVDCSCLPPGSGSGVYIINPSSFNRINVYCDMDTSSGGWTLVQRRQDGSENFYRNWTDYKTGFGDITGEHWLGNDNLHILTNRRAYTVRFDLEDFTGDTAYAEYTVFIVAHEASKYRMTNGGYSGTAGDSFAANNNYMFTTQDQDNDIKKDNCAILWQGGWWYKWCGGSNINGPYKPAGTRGYTSVYWGSWKGTTTLKKVEMKIRPTV